MMVDFALSIWEIWQCRGCDSVVVLDREIVEDDEHRLVGKGAVGPA